MNDPLEQVMPEGWIMARLEELCSHPQYGWTTSASKSSDGLKLLRTTDISSGGVNWDTVPACSQEPDDPKKYLLGPGDIVVSRAGSVGISHLLGECPPAVFASYLIRFKPLKLLLPAYLALFMQSPAYWEQIADQKSGIAVPNVNASKLRKLDIPLPPLAEQERIVARAEALLSRAQSVQQRLAAVPGILKHFRQAVLSHACSGKLTEDWRTDSGHQIETGDELLPHGWHRCVLRDLCSKFEYGSSQKSELEGNVPVLRMGNIQGGKIDWDNLKYSSDRKEIAKYSLEPNTVLFNRTNSPALVGKTAIYRGERPAIFAGYLIRILHGPQLNPEYLNYCLNEQTFREYCMQVKTDGVSQSNINAKKLAKYSLSLPPIEEQGEIIHRVEALFAVAASIEQRVRTARRKADALVQSILAKAFRGELVPTEADVARAEDRDYETAEQLLARIREEMAQPKAAKKTQKKATKRKKTSMKKLSLEQVQDAVGSMPGNSFSFDELHKKLPGDYDSLKDILFAMLEDADSGLKQIFDKKAKAMRLRRRIKK